MRQPDGTWQSGRRYWKPPGRSGSGVEVLDWADIAGKMVTEQARRVLTTAGRPATHPSSVHVGGDEAL